MTRKKAQAERSTQAADVQVGVLWERRPEESPQAFEGFTAFRDCGPRRTLRQAAEELGRSYGLVARWSRQHQWFVRAQGWDRQQWREAEAAARQAREHALHRQLQDADRLQRLAMARLGRLVQRDPDTGELALDPEVSIQDAVRIYRLGLEIEEALPTRPEPDTAEEVETDEIRRMTDEQLRQLITLAKKRAGDNDQEKEDEHSVSDTKSSKADSSRRRGRARKA